MAKVGRKCMRDLGVWKLLVYAVLICGLSGVAHGLTALQEIQITPATSTSGAILELYVSNKTEYKAYYLRNPNRIVIDLPHTQLRADLNKVKLNNTGITTIRHGLHPNHLLRIVLDLPSVNTSNNFATTAIAGKPYRIRLVLPMLAAAAPTTHKNVVSSAATRKATQHRFLVAIDAGHGGHDPGAIGKNGTREKDIALAISKHLANDLNQRQGLRAYMIRDTDKYLNFAQRMQAARTQHADLFVSIHADSFFNKRADGASVFVLSPNKSSSVAARWLASSENRSELAGGLNLKHKNSVLRSVLFDLSQTATAIGSVEVADAVLKSLGKVTKLHNKKVERGGFLVLRSPDIPSILIETGFLSNQKTEIKLRESKYQAKLAAAIADGIAIYFQHKTPAIQ